MTTPPETTQQSEATDQPGAQQDRRLVSGPDFLTALRIPLAIAFLLIDNAAVRLAIVAAVAVTDIGDGIWARHVGGSRLGQALDPVADKLFMAAAFWVVFRSGVLASLEVLGVLLRDIVAALSFLGVSLLGRPKTLPARAGGKAVTVCQALTLVAFLMDSDLVRPLAWATAAISLYAIADYVNVAWTRSGSDSK
ncbi:MAG: CDP-alcohol phosphatidyltransferase family protein [Gemmatimonadota bacterium]|nr:MAG: CDP-alcohol phosphatidyltransferase family protein [Gemmatimonadota bacterium]